MRKQMAHRFLSFFSGISLESYGLEASLPESLRGRFYTFAAGGKFCGVVGFTI